MNIEKQYDLSFENTLALKSSAANYCAISNREELTVFVSQLRSGQISLEKYFIIGEGSNVILPKVYDGLVVRARLKGIEHLSSEGGLTKLKVSAGENWHDFVRYTVAQNLYGLENLSLIPGSVGAAPIQNIGAYGVEVGELIESVEVLNLETFKLQTLKGSDCGFSYRDSLFKRRPSLYLVVSVTFSLGNKNQFNLSYKALAGAVDKLCSESAITLETLTLTHVSDLVMAIRSEKLPDPRGIPNVGSFFKNPIVDESKYKDLLSRFENVPAYPQNSGDVKLAAAWLIDQAGWKGRSVGDLAMYEKQALVLVNRGSANQSDVLKFAEQVAKSVFDLFGVALEIEPITVA